MRILALLLLSLLPAVGQFGSVYPLTGAGRFSDELRPNDVIVWDDFCGSSTSVFGREGWSANNTGGGAVTIGLTGLGQPGRIGIVQLRSAGTLADKASLFMGGASSDGFAMSNGPAFFECAVYLPVLPTTGANYQGRYGLQDATATPSTDGCYFEVTNTSVHAQWKCVTANNGSLTTATAISNAVTGWNYLRWEANTNGTQVIFYLGTSRVNAFPVATNTSNIPIDWAARVSQIWLTMLASNNITVTNYVDFVGYRHQLTTLR